MKLVYPGVFTPQEDGSYTVYIPDMEINTQGDTLPDAISMARDAVGIVGIDMEDDGKPFPAMSEDVPHGENEIVSLVGSLDRKDGRCYAHLHMSAAKSGTNQVVGGHLIRAVISGTAELIVHVLPGTAERRFDEESGLNLWHFE